MPITQKIVTAQTAAQHEALYLRLVALARQVEAVAKKRPEGAVSQTMRTLAEALFFDAQRFIGRRRALPFVAPDLAGLASQLGQALAGLEAFEAQHSFWDNAAKCFVWALPEETVLPVRRLKPKALTRPEQETAELKRIREKLPKMIKAKWAESYERGLRDGALRAAQGQSTADDAEAALPTYPRLLKQL